MPWREGMRRLPEEINLGRRIRVVGSAGSCQTSAMRAIVLSLFALLCAACTTTAPAPAGTAPAPVSPEACLTSALARNRELTTCIGVLSGRCFENPNGETTVGSRDCFTQESRAWRALAETYAQRLRTDVSPTQLAALDAYVAAHDSWRGARCRYASTLYEGGTLAQVVAAACVRDANADLAIDLFQRLNSE